jgi:hypothetical protein
VFEQKALTGGTMPASNLLKIIALGVRVDQCVSAMGLAKKKIKGGKGIETIE